MEYLIRILSEYDGIIGAVLGTVATLITTDWLQNKGKLNIFVLNWTAKYETYYDAGCSASGKKDNDLYDYLNKFELEIYNSSSLPKIMRSVKIEYYNNNKIKYVSNIDNEDTRRLIANCILHTDELEVINFMPKEVIKLKLSADIGENKLDEIEGCNKVLFSYIDEKNKKRSIVLYKGLISKNSK